MGLTDFTGNTPNTPNGNNGLPPGSIPWYPTGPGQGQMPGPDPTQIDPTEFLVNYNEEFKQAGTILFRDSVIQQALSILIGKNKPNTILTGPAGVGKTKIVEDIAYRLAVDDDLIPDKLKGYTIYGLTLADMVAGSSIMGQLEEKVKALISFIEDPKERAILFIDEIHQLVTSTSPTYQKIAQILKPALARGKMRVIGATTTQEAKGLSDDPAFSRRFTKCIVDELGQSETLEILKQSKNEYFTHYRNRITIGDDILESVVSLSDRYRPAGSHRPDNALTLLDRSIADAIISHQMKIATARQENNVMVLNALQSLTLIPITEKQVKNTAIRLATGNAKPESLDVAALRQSISHLKGQDDVIDLIIRTLQEYDLNLFQGIDDVSPKPTTFLLIGPSGVGKTDITNVIAKHLTGIKPITINMTEYNSSASINRIIGSAAGYVGYDSNKELPFDCLMSNPYQVILLDEFEKGNPAVQRLFMQVFDQGYLTTARGDLIDFSKCIIIATTNAGQTNTVKQIGINTKMKEKKCTDIDIKTLSRYFDVELINRFEYKILFHPIDRETYRNIVQELYKDHLAVIAKTHPRMQFLPEIPDDDLDKIVSDTYAEEFGARPAEQAVRKYTLDQVL